MVICFCQAEKQKCMKQLYLYLINLQSPVHCGSCTFETLVRGVWSAVRADLALPCFYKSKEESDICSCSIFILVLYSDGTGTGGKEL